MTDKLKVAIAGLAHVHAIGFYSTFKNIQKKSISSVWRIFRIRKAQKQNR